VIDGVDLQHTGKVRKVNTSPCRQPLIPALLHCYRPWAIRPQAKYLTCPFSDVATHVATAIKADKLIAFIDGDGVINSEGELVRQLSLQECKEFLEAESQTIHPDLRQALSACYLTCLQGVARAQLVSYATDGALLTELFTRDGLGTMVYSGQYEQLRTATIDDVGGIIELITPHGK
jgi:amino-acid N-acetyltransferase